MEGKEPSSAPTGAGDIVSSVVEDFRRAVDARGMAIDLDVDSDLPVVLADQPTLAHALWNLLDNAVKYSPGAQPVSVSVRRHPAGVAIAVEDRGLGIPAAERKEIFERFVRGQTASRLGIKGTGLGLAIVSQIVAAHGGRIELESALGRGARSGWCCPPCPTL